MVKTKSFAGSTGGDKSSPVKRPKPRIPDEYSGLQYNFCKNQNCEQFRLIPTNDVTKRGKKVSGFTTLYHDFLKGQPETYQVIF